MTKKTDDHYIPKFYLRRWCGSDGKLCRYSRPHIKMVAKRVTPKQTGKLYGLYGATEERFMKLLDTRASEALTMLEEDNPKIRSSSVHRSAWSRFLMSLMMRMPDHIDVIKKMLSNEYQRRWPELEAKYAEKKGPGDPKTLESYLELVGDFEENWIMPIVESLKDHDGIGEVLNSMRWFMRDISSGDAEYLTSDRPLVMIGALAEYDFAIMLPVGPKRLFIAVHNLETQQRIERKDPVQHIASLNKSVVGRAKEYVYATDDSHVDVVASNFGTIQLPSVFHQLRDFRARKNQEGLE